MKITYKRMKLQKICTDASMAERMYSRVMAEKIQGCIDVIGSAECVELLVRGRVKGCHKLEGKRKGQYAMHLEEPFRLVFTVSKNAVQIARIEAIVDYH